MAPTTTDWLDATNFWRTKRGYNNYTDKTRTTTIIRTQQFFGGPQQLATTNFWRTATIIRTKRGYSCPTNFWRPIGQKAEGSRRDKQICVCPRYLCFSQIAGAGKSALVLQKTNKHLCFQKTGKQKKHLSFAANVKRGADPPTARHPPKTQMTSGNADFLLRPNRCFAWPRPPLTTWPDEVLSLFFSQEFGKREKQEKKKKLKR